MQIDFHFYAIYALARAAGITDQNAHIIAYASQHTDDAKYEHALDFENGGRFQQVLTAHKYVDPKVLSKSTCYNIWVPYHFLPGGDGVNFYEKLTTKPQSTITGALTQRYDALGEYPYMLQSLGLLLHVIADTWSHQNFIGLQHGRNDVRGLRIDNEHKGFIDKMLEEAKSKFIEFYAPMLGHTQAGHLPDEPFRTWRYEDYQGNSIEINNHDRTMKAAQQCYEILATFADSYPTFASGSPNKWNKVSKTLEKTFSNDGDLDARVDNWCQQIGSDSFGYVPTPFDQKVQYQDRQWFKDAVQVEMNNTGEETFRRKSNFEKSNWKYFHDAAALHKFILLHDLLPEFGIICG
jgi:hypothetical protein